MWCSSITVMFSIKGVLTISTFDSQPTKRGKAIKKRYSTMTSCGSNVTVIILQVTCSVGVQTVVTILRIDARRFAPSRVTFFVSSV
uniref:Putative secreted protein n=1 Tax=Anopheles darlingi TaxID=43151 RepID=A0A2M4D8K5_ANODA